MDRRTLLIGLSAAVTWLSVSGCRWLILNGQGPERGDIVAPGTALSKQLAELADPLFSDYSAGRSPDALHKELSRKGVISTHHGINHTQVISLARYEPLIIYKGFYYTQTELELYALAYLRKDHRGKVDPHNIFHDV
ncbi:hypothetical protein [Marinobacter sp. ATCH36]|uniref:hypothetical protein n=1 Tax=Marinobacter sp. ATCH36 TaxID=2945106 RepID=UPI0020213886|nr:hypothetical protein [Marinobacter sp. ATCH36]MCL7945438.1 hypothetical protein [Marinobacter sp. ATCH36]